MSVSIKCDDKVREKKEKKKRERVREIKQARDRNRHNMRMRLIMNFIYLQLANILMQYVQYVDNSTSK